MAEKAVPGDALYQMKVSVNEPVVGMFTLSKEGNTAWQEKLVERRLDEAQKVVAEGKLDTQTQAEIKTRVHDQVDKFAAAAKDLSEDKNKEVVSSELAIRLEAALKAHQDILLQVQADGSVTVSTRENVKNLLSALKEGESTVRGHREESELHLGEGDNNANASTTTKVSAENKQAVAEKILGRVKAVYQEEKVGLATSTRITIEAKIVAADKLVASGKADVVATNYANARDTFQTVIQLANDIRVEVLTNSIKDDLEIDVMDNQEDKNAKNDEKGDKREELDDNDKKSNSSSTSRKEDNESDNESSAQDKNEDNKNETGINSQKSDTEASLKIEVGEKSQDREDSGKVEIQSGLRINN